MKRKVAENAKIRKEIFATPLNSCGWNTCRYLLGVATLGFDLMQPHQAQILRAQHQSVMNHSVFDVPVVCEIVENHPNRH